MEEKKQTKETTEEEIIRQPPKQGEKIFTNELPVNCIVLDSISLSSPFEDMDSLIKKLKDLLKDKNVLDYLEVSSFKKKLKNIGGSYFG